MSAHVLLNLRKRKMRGLPIKNYVLMVCNSNQLIVNGNKFNTEKSKENL